MLSVKDFCSQRVDDFPASRYILCREKLQVAVDLSVEGTYNRVYLNMETSADRRMEG
jgi:hypothetical protein